MSTVNRREESALATRQLLVDEAAKLFSRQGFSNTTLSEIVEKAGATKGALYHHFANKEELFAICYEQQATRIAAIIREVESTEDPWRDAIEQCRAFLGCATKSSLKSVSIQEAITILGWQRWRALDSAHTMGALERSIERLHESGMLGSYDRRLLADSVYAMLVNAMMVLSESTDRAATEAELMRQLKAFLSGVLIR